MSEPLKSCGVASSVSSDVGIVDDECVDVVVRYDIRHYFLVFATRTTRLLLLRGVTASLVLAHLPTQWVLLGNLALEDYLGAVIGVLLETLAEDVGVALLRRLVVEIEHFCLC